MLMYTVTNIHEHHHHVHSATTFHNRPRLPLSCYYVAIKRSDQAPLSTFLNHYSLISDLYETKITRKNSYKSEPGSLSRENWCQRQHSSFDQLVECCESRTVEFWLTLCYLFLYNSTLNNLPEEEALVDMADRTEDTDVRSDTDWSCEYSGSDYSYGDSETCDSEDESCPCSECAFDRDDVFNPSAGTSSI